MEKIRNQVGLQEKPVKIMRLGEKKHSNPEPDYSRPVRVEFCREDPVIYLLAKRNLNIGGQTHWFGRDLTHHETKLEFEARKKRRERQKEMRPTDSSNTNESDNGEEPVRGPNNEQNWHQLDYHNLKIFNLHEWLLAVQQTNRNQVHCILL